MVGKQFLNPPGLARPRGYTHVVTTHGGKTVYVSGQVARNAKGEIVGRNDLGRQAEQAYENLKVALGAAGASLADVVKLNVYIVNFKPEDREVQRKVRRRYFGQEHLPASTLIGVQALAEQELLIEVEAIAVLE